MARATRFTQLTGCRVPVQQAPMGSVATTALAVAVAVAEAGGVGSIVMRGMSPAQVDKVLGGMAARTTGLRSRLVAMWLRCRVLRRADTSGAGQGMIEGGCHVKW